MKTQLQRINEYIDTIDETDRLNGSEESVILSGGDGIMPLWTSNGDCTNNDGTCVKSTNSIKCTNAKGMCIDASNKKVCFSGGGSIIGNGDCQLNPEG